MLRIKNLTNSPYPILLADGSKELLPARGEIDADIHPQHLPLYRSLGYFVISNVSEGGGQVEVAREEDAGEYRADEGHAGEAEHAAHESACFHDGREDEADEEPTGRAAGRHGMAGGAVRRQLRRDLQRELDRLKPPHR